MKVAMRLLRHAGHGPELATVAAEMTGFDLLCDSSSHNRGTAGFAVEICSCSERTGLSVVLTGDRSAE